VVDVVKVLTDSPTPRQYWGKIKYREFKILKLSPIWVRLKLKSSDEKKYLTDCANTKSLFRIIQSIPSKKAEPLKQWLAQLGQERIEEIENPELGQNKIKQYYELKDYPEKWIEKRIRGITIRQELTKEWEDRDVAIEDFGILTNDTIQNIILNVLKI
jgi:NAD-dependent DNA ligase